MAFRCAAARRSSPSKSPWATATPGRSSSASGERSRAARSSCTSEPDLDFEVLAEEIEKPLELDRFEPLSLQTEEAWRAAKVSLLGLRQAPDFSLEVLKAEPLYI